MCSITFVYLYRLQIKVQISSWSPTPTNLCAPEGSKPWQNILVTPALHPGILPCILQSAAVILQATGPSDLSSLMLYETPMPALGTEQPNLDFDVGETIEINSHLEEIQLKTIAPKVQDC